MTESHIDTAEHARMLNILATGGSSQRNPGPKHCPVKEVIQLKNLLSILIAVAISNKKHTQRYESSLLVC
jgi:hypothetical protein